MVGVHQVVDTRTPSSKIMLHVAHYLELFAPDPNWDLQEGPPSLGSPICDFSIWRGIGRNNLPARVAGIIVKFGEAQRDTRPTSLTKSSDPNVIGSARCVWNINGWASGSG
jgi:hypothetical protein